MTADRTDPRYRRALWIVVVLNAGFGVIEMAGGVLADSQALQADALDFIGDGLITLTGLVALSRGARWRARVALAQGWFLGALGVWVLATTVLRLFDATAPEAASMGVLGAIGLFVNLAAAAVLVPFRHGDVGARAIWLFSRNDALGNIAVVAAALLVGATRTPWPDLAVAFVIAGLFLQSSLSIVRRAKAELRVAGGAQDSRGGTTA